VSGFHYIAEEGIEYQKIGRSAQSEFHVKIDFNRLMLLGSPACSSWSCFSCKGKKRRKKTCQLARKLRHVKIIEICLEVDLPNT
jgi:hypothetical protein